MPEFTLDDGTEIEEFDSSTITVRSPSGRRTKMARRLAPDRFRSAVEQREQERGQPQFQASGPVIELAPTAAPAAPEPAAAPSTEGRQVFDAQGRTLQPAAPPQQATPQVGLGGGRVLELETPEQFQRRQGEVRAPLAASTQQQPQEQVTFHRPAAAPAQPQRPQFATATTTETTRQRTRLAPGQQQALDESRGRSAEATGAIQESLRGEAVDKALAGQERAELGEERDRISTDFDRRRIAVEEVNRKRERDLFEQQQALQDDIADDEIDSGRLWRNKSTGKKISLAIGAFFSGFVRRGRGQSPILQQIQDEIDRDIQQQRELFKSKRVASNKLDNLYAQARRRGLDDLAAVEVARGAAMGRVESQLRDMSDRVQSEAQAAALTRKADEFALRREENLQQSILTTADKVQTRTQRKRVPVAGAGGGAVDQKGRPVSFPGLVSTGKRTSPFTTKETNDLSDKAEAIASTLQNIRLLRSLREQHGAELFDSEAKSQAQAAANDIMTGLQKASGGGVMTDRDLERLQKLVPDISEVGLRRFVGASDPFLDRIRGLEKQFLGKMRSGLQARFGMDLAPSLLGLKTAQQGFQ